MELGLRLAREGEAEICYRMIEEARRYQESMDNDQWAGGYPNLELLEEDIRLGRGYAFTLEDAPVGYTCLLFDGEPGYAEIDGAWTKDEPYAVVHRMGFGDCVRGKGVAGQAFRRIQEICLEKGIRSIRIDTDMKNGPMKRVLAREGFTYCGTVPYRGIIPEGDPPKLGYQLDF